MEMFKHTQAVESLIEQGKLEEAAELHHHHVKHMFARARAGECIDLSDLMAAKQILVESREKKGDEDANS
jgi:hypothetical protein